jgi:hypothetical protein
MTTLDNNNKNICGTGGGEPEEENPEIQIRRDALGDIKKSENTSKSELVNLLNRVENDRSTVREMLIEEAREQDNVMLIVASGVCVVTVAATIVLA